MQSRPDRMRRKTASFLLALFAGALSVGPLPAQAQGPQPDLAGVLARKELRVALPSYDVPPFFHVRDGVLQGMDIELAKNLAAELGVRLVFDRRAKTFNAVVDIVAAREADVAICKLSRTLLRARVVQFSRPYLVLKHALVVNRVRFAELARGRDAADVIRDLKAPIGVIGGTAYVDFAQRYFPGATLNEFDNWDDLIAALRAGRIVAGYRDEVEIKKLIRDDPSVSLTLRTVTLNDLVDTIGMALPLSSPHFTAFLDMYIAEKAGTKGAKDVLARYEKIMH